MPRKKRDDAADEAKIGDNSNLNEQEKTKLAGFVGEIERIDAEVRELTSDRGNIYKAAKNAGFDNRALREVIRRRRMEHSKRVEWETAVDAYLNALGDFSSTPLGRAGLPQQPQA